MLKWLKKWFPVEPDVDPILSKTWDTISQIPLTEDFIRENANKLNWRYISSNQVLSENFIREFQSKVDWIRISYFQKLSESFIREFANQVAWDNIFWQQKLSEDFIKEFQNDLNSFSLETILVKQTISINLLKELKINFNLFKSMIG